MKIKTLTLKGILTVKNSFLICFVEFILKISGYSMKLFSLAEFSLTSKTVGSNLFLSCSNKICLIAPLKVIKQHDVNCLS